MLETVQVLLVIINIYGGTPITVPMLDAAQCVAAAEAITSVRQGGRGICIRAKR